MRKSNTLKLFSDADQQTGRPKFLRSSIPRKTIVFKKVTVSPQGRSNECDSKKLECHRKNGKQLETCCALLKHKGRRKRKHTRRVRTNNCHSSTLAARCSNTKNGARKECAGRPYIHRMSANCHSCFFN